MPSKTDNFLGKTKDIIKNDAVDNVAVIIGGSNGIGLAISIKLKQKGYSVIILDIVPPEKNSIPEDIILQYKYFNMAQLDEDLISELANNKATKLLMITAGIGRVAPFEMIHIAEIQQLMSINAVALMKIIKLFYERIKSEERFYCGIMGSIAGWVSSPLFAVYAASKAAVCRFVESINIELEENGYDNRILNVSPGSLKGTRFNGGENDLIQVYGLVEQIIEQLMRSQTLFIPQYEEIYKHVINRYYKDPVRFGKESYMYKKESGRENAGDSARKASIGYMSGTFDLFHIGHLNILKRAKESCDYLIVGVHRDASHKGKEAFIPFEERKAIVGACKYVDKVVEACAEDSDAWQKWHYDYLFVGSDYRGSDRFKRYETFFRDKKVEIIYFPYTVSTSSTQLREVILSKANSLWDHEKMS